VKEVAASPALVAALASLDKAGGQATASTTAATGFQNEVNLGVLQASNNDTAHQVALKVAPQLGNVGTEFSILSQEFKDGKPVFAELVSVGRQNADILKQQNIGTMSLDIALGDLTGAAPAAKQGLLDGSVSVDTDVKIQKAANDETARQADLLTQVDLRLGNFSAVLQSETQSITTPRGNAKDKVTPRFPERDRSGC
jgi:hypothetical protein